MSFYALIPALALGSAYVLLLLLYLAGWILEKEAKLPPGFVPQTKISIIIPARNEAERIGSCIESILAQDYPAGLFEIIVVDDFSEDDTAAVVAAFESPVVRLLELADFVDDRNTITAFKKIALGTGIANSNGGLIITTDADCTAGTCWLKHMAAAYEQSGPAAIVAPVSFTGSHSVVGLFQSLDFMTMQGITAAARRLNLGRMANGANFAFSRAAYDAVSGYEGTTHIASGDDYLLLVKLADTFPAGIHYLKSRDAIVHTPPQPSWKALLNQRIRWASKSGKYKDHRLTAVLMIVYLFNVLLLILAVSALFNQAVRLLLFALFGMKVLVEMLFLVPVSGFFNKRRQLPVFPFLQPLHVLYICLAGFLGYIGNYEWKGRRL